MADLRYPLPGGMELPAAASPTSRTQFFRWRDDWCLGIAAMDRDHQRLALLLDGLAAGFGGVDTDTDREGVFGLSGGASAPQRLLRELAALADETREHFAREEALMRATDYPDFVEHRAEHEIMRAELIELTREIAARGDHRLDQGTLCALKAWFLGHLLDTDRRLARHLLETGLGLRH